MPLADFIVRLPPRHPRPTVRWPQPTRLPPPFSAPQAADYRPPRPPKPNAVEAVINNRPLSTFRKDSDKDSETYLPMDRFRTLRRCMSVDSPTVMNRTRDNTESVYVEMEPIVDRTQNVSSARMYQSVETLESGLPPPPPPLRLQQEPTETEYGDYSWLPPPVPYKTVGDMCNTPQNEVSNVTTGTVARRVTMFDTNVRSLQPDSTDIKFHYGQDNRQAVERRQPPPPQHYATVKRAYKESDDTETSSRPSENPTLVETGTAHLQHPHDAPQRVVTTKHVHGRHVTLLNVNGGAEEHQDRQSPVRMCPVHNRVVGQETTTVPTTQEPAVDLIKEDAILEVVSNKINVLIDSIDRQNKRIESMRRAFDQQQQHRSVRPRAAPPQKPPTYRSMDIFTDDGFDAEHCTTEEKSDSNQKKKKKRGSWKMMSCVSR